MLEKEFGEKRQFTQKPKLSPRNEFNLVFVIPDIDKKIRRVSKTQL